ncbi:hypothetical protein B5F29_00300 [Lachnoclostridium sp. An196]|uniref:hypothetical protein n=1 Tax=Lachnoclostridium sp. An196 TaxID=1965583 RepID=UPI000B38E1CA|nr:hypothetical protein [Lachnoclostridium sp. An196]OUP22224.1 hypothetical protein B5F29_00300 [Lachnoclostridium sp. An196]
MEEQAKGTPGSRLSERRVGQSAGMRYVQKSGTVYVWYFWFAGDKQAGGSMRVVPREMNDLSRPGM